MKGGERMFAEVNLGNTEVEELYAKYLDAKCKLLTALQKERIEVTKKETASES